MTFDLFALIIIICILLIIIILVQSVVIRTLCINADEGRNEAINKLMSKDFKDYSEGTHRIDAGAAALAAAKKAPKPKLNDDIDDVENLDEVPVI